MEDRNIFAYTAPGFDSPEFVSINRKDGKLYISVRSAGYGGSIAEMQLPYTELDKLFHALRRAHPISIYGSGSSKRPRPMTDITAIKARAEAEELVLDLIEAICDRENGPLSKSVIAQAAVEKARDALLAEVERLREGIRHLGSSETRTLPFAIKDNLEGSELKARMDYARHLIEKGQANDD